MNIKRPKIKNKSDVAQISKELAQFHMSPLTVDVIDLKQYVCDMMETFSKLSQDENYYDSCCKILDKFIETVDRQSRQCWLLVTDEKIVDFLVNEYIMQNSLPLKSKILRCIRGFLNCFFQDISTLPVCLDRCCRSIQIDTCLFLQPVLRRLCQLTCVTLLTSSNVSMTTDCLDEHLLTLIAIFRTQIVQFLPDSCGGKENYKAMKKFFQLVFMNDLFSKNNKLCAIYCTILNVETSTKCLDDNNFRYISDIVTTILNKSQLHSSSCIVATCFQLITHFVMTPDYCKMLNKYWTLDQVQIILRQFVHCVPLASRESGLDMLLAVRESGGGSHLLTDWMGVLTAYIFKDSMLLRMLTDLFKADHDRLADKAMKLFTLIIDMKTVSNDELQICVKTTVECLQSHLNRSRQVAVDIKPGLGGESLPVRLGMVRSLCRLTTSLRLACGLMADQRAGPMLSQVCGAAGIAPQVEALACELLDLLHHRPLYSGAIRFQRQGSIDPDSNAFCDTNHWLMSCCRPLTLLVFILARGSLCNPDLFKSPRLAEIFQSDLIDPILAASLVRTSASIFPQVVMTLLSHSGLRDNFDQNMFGKLINLNTVAISQRSNQDPVEDEERPEDTRSHYSMPQFSPIDVDQDRLQEAVCAVLEKHSASDSDVVMVMHQHLIVIQAERAELEAALATSQAQEQRLGLVLRASQSRAASTGMELARMVGHAAHTEEQRLQIRADAASLSERLATSSAHNQRLTGEVAAISEQLQKARATSDEADRCNEEMRRLLTKAELSIKTKDTEILKLTEIKETIFKVLQR